MTDRQLYRCNHCSRLIPWELGCDDATERALGPICDDCADFDATRVIVCGGRDYNDVDRVWKVLDAVSPWIVIHGGALGADAIAEGWAEALELEHIEFPADWKRHGRKAGPLRNQRMLDEGKPTLVVAFPGGRGTADMVRRARKAGVKVLEVKDGK